MIHSSPFGQARNGKQVSHKPNADTRSQPVDDRFEWTDDDQLLAEASPQLKYQQQTKQYSYNPQMQNYSSYNERQNDRGTNGQGSNHYLDDNSRSTQRTNNYKGSTDSGEKIHANPFKRSSRTDERGLDDNISFENAPSSTFKNMDASTDEWKQYADDIASGMGLDNPLMASVAATTSSTLLGSGLSAAMNSFNGFWKKMKARFQGLLDVDEYYVMKKLLSLALTPYHCLKLLIRAKNTESDASLACLELYVPYVCLLLCTLYSTFERDGMNLIAVLRTIVLIESVGAVVLQSVANWLNLPHLCTLSYVQTASLTGQKYFYLLYYLVVTYIFESYTSKIINMLLCDLWIVCYAIQLARLNVEFACGGNNNILSNLNRMARDNTTRKLSQGVTLAVVLCAQKYLFFAV